MPRRDEFESSGSGYDGDETALARRFAAAEAQAAIDPGSEQSYPIPSLQAHPKWHLCHKQHGLYPTVYSIALPVALTKRKCSHRARPNFKPVSRRPQSADASASFLFTSGNRQSAPLFSDPGLNPRRARSMKNAPMIKRLSTVSVTLENEAETSLEI
jgi:hypothetical protein